MEKINKIKRRLKKTESEWEAKVIIPYICSHISVVITLNIYIDAMKALLSLLFINEETNAPESQ